MRKQHSPPATDFSRAAAKKPRSSALFKVWLNRTWNKSRQEVKRQNQVHSQGSLPVQPWPVAAAGQVKLTCAGRRPPEASPCQAPSAACLALALRAPEAATAAVAAAAASIRLSSPPISTQGGKLLPFSPPAPIRGWTPGLLEVFVRFAEKFAFFVKCEVIGAAGEIDRWIISLKLFLFST